MTSDEIRIQFLKQKPKTSLTKIGRQVDVSPAAVHNIIERVSVSERIMLAVSAAINIPPDLVFPEHIFKE